VTDTSSKIAHSSAELADRLTTLARPIVFTNGCFDVLHRGHIDYLERAALLGKSLVVGVNSDESVRRLEKGSGRPLNPLDDRLALLAALACVSIVVPFEDDTPIELIKLVRPDHLVKGGDWPTEKIVGAKEVLARGGHVHSLPFRYNRSTTDLIRRIREHG